MRPVVYTEIMEAKKPTKKDITWKLKVEKQVEAEEVKLGHPKGKERFDHVMQRAKKVPDRKS